MCIEVVSRQLHPFDTARLCRNRTGGQAEPSRGRSRQSSAVADLLQVIRVRVLRWLEREGVVECTEHPELTLLDDDFAEREPALAALAMGAVSGRLPAGPEIRQRPPLTLHRSPTLPAAPG
ncbi:hypothetical protein ACFL5O_10650 [Myxococcota bacterium]